MTANTGATRRRTGTGNTERPLDWPGDPETVTAAGIDFEALAHVLANTCRRGGCYRHYHSVAAHAVIVSEEVGALDGLGEEDRRRLALHALVVDAPSAWLRGGCPGSQRAAERAGRLAAGVAAAVREAAGLDAAPDEEQAELLRLVTRMAAAAESRDLLDGSAPTGAGVAFSPLKRRIRPVPPDKAAQAWLARFRALGVPPGEGAGGKAKPGAAGKKEDPDRGRKAAPPPRRWRGHGDPCAGDPGGAGRRGGVPGRDPGRRAVRRAPGPALGRALPLHGP